MKSAFYTQLVNDPFGDPVLYVELRYERRGLLFDCGDISGLSSKQLLRITDVFVSHGHMDHLIGFDRLLRISIGRERHLRFVGPPGIIGQIGHKLAGYTWNLIDRYENELTFEILEIHPGGIGLRGFYQSRNAFRGERVQRVCLRDGIIRDEQRIRVRATVLDHGTPCLAFALEEREHVAVRSACVENMGLGVGPWLRDLKAAARQRVPPSTPLRARWRDPQGGRRERVVTLGELAPCLIYAEGHRLAYVVDARYHRANALAIRALAQGADALYIEAAFLDEDAARAADRSHLTARQAGTLAKQANVKRVIPMHFSPRYEGAGERLVEELQRAFSGASRWTPPALE